MLKSMINMEKPQLCFLQETMCNNTTLGSILSKVLSLRTTVNVCNDVQKKFHYQKELSSGYVLMCVT